jgi:threonine/homoserine/homoserine lactone efflux protein
MDFAAVISFILTVVMLSLSGVLMPGPVTAVTLTNGSRSPHAGAWVAVGHGVVELPLMALIYYGVGALFKIAAVKTGIGLAGGAVLLWMGAGMLRDYRKVTAPDADGAGQGRSPFAAGMVLSLANPYFLVWWATAGAALVTQSFKFGLIGFAILAVSHWLCDLVWYYLLSIMSFHGGKFFGRKLQQAVFIICGLALFYFSGYFLAGAVLSMI